LGFELWALGFGLWALRSGVLGLRFVGGQGKGVWVLGDLHSHHTLSANLYICTLPSICHLSHYIVHLHAFSPCWLDGVAGRRVPTNKVHTYICTLPSILHQSYYIVHLHAFSPCWLDGVGGWAGSYQ